MADGDVTFTMTIPAAIVPALVIGRPGAVQPTASTVTAAVGGEPGRVSTGTPGRPT